jgi:lipopolysaccharide biosynthesis glycosyltransferase
MPWTLPIACSIDERYALPLAVMLESAKRRLCPEVRPVLYLLHAGLRPATLEILSSLVETHPIVPTAAQIAACPFDRHYPPAASFPILLDELLPAALEQVLFLDPDLLVMDDLAILWRTPMDGRVLAAVPDGAVPYCSSARGVRTWRPAGIPRDASYFNGGVLLIHLGRWRERNVGPRVRQYIQSARGALDFVHQEAFNAVLWDDWKRLDMRWNLLASRAGRFHGRIAPEIWRRPGIVHFSGRMKPWQVPVGGPFNAPYQEALQRILPMLRPEPPALRKRIDSVYDRYFRPACYPIERLLWRRRWI